MRIIPVIWNVSRFQFVGDDPLVPHSSIRWDIANSKGEYPPVRKLLIEQEPLGPTIFLSDYRHVGKGDGGNRYAILVQLVGRDSPIQLFVVIKVWIGGTPPLHHLGRDISH
jgi:hypothetical protein